MGFIEGRGGQVSIPPRSKCREWHGPRREAFVGVASRKAVRREATAGDDVVDGDGQVRVGVLYLSMGDVANCLAGLGRVTRHGCSVTIWKRKTTEGWNYLRILGSGGPMRS